MAAPNQSLADFQRHVASNPDALHVAFDTYPWTKDRVFLVSSLSLEPQGFPPLYIYIYIHT